METSTNQVGSGNSANARLLQLEGERYALPASYLLVTASQSGYQAEWVILVAFNIGWTQQSRICFFRSPDFPPVSQIVGNAPGYNARRNKTAFRAV